MSRGNLPDLDDLSLLAAVAGTGSVGRAATQHGISQPAASMRLRAMERRYRLTLLHRSPTGSALTTEGAAILDWARPMLDAAESFSRGVAALRDRHRDRLRLAASLTVADHLVPAWLVALHTVQPDLAVSLRVGNSDEVADLVRAGSVDLGFVEGATAPEGLRSRTVGQDELAVVVAAGHRWSRRRRGISPAELAGTPLVLREEGSGTREALEHALARHGLTPEVAVEVGATTAIKAAVTAGRGPSVLSRLAVGAELADGRLVAVPVVDLDLRRRFRAVWRAGRMPPPPAATMLAVALRTASPPR